MGRPRVFEYTVGMKIGKWTVLDIITKPRKHTAYWCQCECGEKKLVTQSALKNGSSTGCRDCRGQSQRRWDFNKEDLVPNSYWTVLEQIPLPRGSKYRVKCRCGNESLVAARHIHSGKSRSCGCIGQKCNEYIIQQLFKMCYKNVECNLWFEDRSFEADIFLPEEEIVVEVDGGYHFTEKGKENDRKKNKKWKEMGYEVVRIPLDRKYFKDPFGTVDEIFKNHFGQKIGARLSSTFKKNYEKWTNEYYSQDKFEDDRTEYARIIKETKILSNKGIPITTSWFQKNCREDYNTIIRILRRKSKNGSYSWNTFLKDAKIDINCQRWSKARVEECMQEGLLEGLVTSSEFTAKYGSSLPHACLKFSGSFTEIRDKIAKELGINIPIKYSWTRETTVKVIKEGLLEGLVTRSEFIAKYGGGFIDACIRFFRHFAKVRDKTAEEIGISINTRKSWNSNSIRESMKEGLLKDLRTHNEFLKEYGGGFIGACRQYCNMTFAELRDKIEKDLIKQGII